MSKQVGLVAEEISSLPTRPRLSYFDRLVVWIFAILLVATIVFVACQTFICFLWFSNTSNSVWLEIALRGWIPRSVTLTALCLRWATTAQAAACTSQLAALLLEDFQVSQFNIASVSMFTVHNTGPLSLLKLLWSQRHGASVGSLAVVLVATTSLLQFTSTALLSDVRSSAVQSRQIETNVFYGILDTSYRRVFPLHESDGTKYLYTSPLVYPMFAEYTEPPYGGKQDGVSDTGLSMRAFLPFGLQETRESIIKYSGNAAVLDTRVVCMRPTLSKLLITGDFTGPAYIEGRFRTETSAWMFNKTLQSPALPGPFGSIDGSDSTSFKCAFAVPNPAEVSKEWPLSLCFPERTQAGIISPIEVDVDPSERLPTAYILVNMTGNPEFTTNESGTFDPSTGAGFVNIQEVTDNGEWADISSSVPGLSLSLTVCYSSPVAKGIPIEALRAVNEHHEATSNWSPGSLSYDTLAIRHQLGATKHQSSRDVRGIFTLTNKTSWGEPESGINLFSYSAFSEHWDVGNDTVLMCTSCLSAVIVGNYSQSCVVTNRLPSMANRQHAALFNDILQDTLDPALALQSHFTVLFGMTYYDHLVQFDLSRQVSLVRSADVLRPTSKVFFIVVLLVSAVHLVTVVVVNLLFCVRCKHIQLGNAWAVLAHLRGSGTRSWLRRANGQKDSMVKKWMAEAGEGDVLVGVKQVDGRQQIVRKRV
jgi:hypothetical protein